MTKNIIVKKNSSFNYIMFQPFCIGSQSSTYNGTEDIVLQNLPVNNFTKVNNGPTSVTAIWPKNYNNEWLIYDGTSLWQLVNENFSIIVSNMSSSFGQTDVTNGAAWEYSIEKNLFYYSSSGSHSKISEEYYTPGKLYTLSGNNYSIFTNYSDYLNNQFPSISGLTYPSITLLKVTAHGPYFLGVFLIEHGSGTYNHSLKIVWSTNGSSWSNKTIQGYTNSSPYSSTSYFGLASANNNYLLVDFSPGAYLGSEYNSLYGTNPSSFASGSISGAAVYDPPLTMTKMGNYYVIGQSGYANAATTQDFVTFSMATSATSCCYNNGFYNLSYSSQIYKNSTYYYKEYSDSFKVKYDNGIYNYYGLINNNKVYTLSQNNGWSCCNLSDLVVQS